MRISRTASQYDNKPTTLELSWDGLADMLRKPRETTCAVTGQTKAGVRISTTICPSLTRDEHGERLSDKCEARKIDMWSPSIFDGIPGPKGGWKSLKNVVAMGCLTFDIDHQPRAAFAQTLDNVRAAGLASIVHTTHSHDPAHNDYCARLILQLTTELDLSKFTAEKVRAFYAEVAAKYGIPFDTQTKDETRIYFMPSVPRGGPKYLFAKTEGTSIDYFEPTTIRGAVGSSVPGWDEASESALPTPGAVSGNTNIGELFSKILRSKSIEPEIKEAFKRSRDGKPFALEGARDTTLYKAASKAVFCCYDADLYTLLELFRGGCNAMAPRADPDGKTWLGKVEFDLERAMERREAERADNKAKSELMMEAGFRSAVASVPEGSIVSTVVGLYTPDDLATFYASQGCKDELDFRERWVIRNNGANWIFKNGRYQKAVADRDMQFTVKRDLIRAGIPMFRDGANGEAKTLSWEQILEGHSSLARTVIGDLNAKESMYNPISETFIEAVCPMRELPAEYDADIEEWLKRFHSEQLMEWLAAFPRLDTPTALLYLCGPEGIGKTLLPKCLARFWTEGGPTRFKDVFGKDFNSALAECPLIFADEGIPKVPGIMDEIREMVGNDQHSLNRKFMPTVRVKGHIRMVASGNNENILNTNAELGERDVKAVAKRILYLDCGDNTAPGDWLKHLIATKGRPYIGAWVERDRVAKHVLWMSQTRPITAFDRTVGGGSEQFAENLSTTSGNVPAVLAFLAQYLSEPVATRQPTKLARIGGGSFLVSTELLSDKALFERYVPSRRVLPPDKISTALMQIRTGTKEIDGRMFHDLRVSTVLGWMKRNQVGDYNGAKARIEAVS